MLHPAVRARKRRWPQLACVLVLLGCAPRVARGPDALLARGWDMYRAGEYTQALAIFEQLARMAAPTSTMQVAAWYGMATTWNLRRPNENPGRARRWYQRIISQAPPGDYTAWSLLALARMQHLALTPTGDADAVRRAYQVVLDAYPGHPAADEAFLHQQASLVATLDTNAALRALASIRAYLQHAPTSTLASSLHGLMGRCYNTLGDYPQQLAMEIKECETRVFDPANPYMDNSMQYWHIATTAEFLAGDFAVARHYYQLFIDAYPNDQRRFGARQALQRMSALEARLRPAAPAAGGPPP